MTLLQMLDVLESGCITLQKRSGELAAALSQAGNNVTSPVVVEELPKKRAPAKTKGKATKGRSKSKTAKPKKKAQLALALAAAAADGTSLPEDQGKNEDGPNRGKRQALGMSFSKLRAAIQARRGERRGDDEASDR